MKNRHLTFQLIWIVLFSIAMGYLETAVVVYLRDIYYPQGFVFPLVPIHTKDLIVELGRELATLIMLIGVGILTARTKPQRFAFFIMSFAIWDIFYYIFLKIILGWPVSLMTWDILFLLPLPWVGPVLAPCILSLTMIFLAAMILHLEKRYEKIAIPTKSWIWLIIGALIVISSFCIDPIKHLAEFAPTSKMQYMPSDYNWWIFILGEAIILYGIFALVRYSKKDRDLMD